jgi:hypothetical protein
LSKSKPRQGLTTASIDILVLALAAFSAIPVVYILVPRIERMIEASGNTIGGMGNVWAAAIMFPVAVIWVITLFKSRPVVPLGLFVIMLPLFGRLRNVVGIAIYRLDPPSGWVEYLGPTSLLIFVLFGVLLLRRVPMRRLGSRLFSTVEACLWLFVMMGTFAQILHHEPESAILLSLNGLWQYLPWFYVVVGAVRDSKDIKFVLACFSGMIVVNILLRSLFTGVLYDLTWAQGGFFAFRFYASGLGWATNYSILLVIAIVLNVGLLGLTKNRSLRAMWLAFSIAQMVELLFTFTRGAYLALAFSFLLLFVLRSTRKSVTILIGVVLFGLFISAFIWGDVVRSLLLTRISFQETDIVRLNLFFQSLLDAAHDWGLGFGIFKEPMYYNQWTDLLLPSHNLFLSLTHAVGLWSALAWLGALLATMVELGRSLRHSSEVEATRLQISLLVALLAWFIFANITGTGITEYWPVEATLTIYTLMGLSVALISGAGNRQTVVKIQTDDTGR